MGTKFFMYLFLGLAIIGCSSMRDVSSNNELSYKILKNPNVLEKLLLDTNIVTFKTYSKYKKNKSHYINMINYINKCSSKNCNIVLLDSGLSVKNENDYYNLTFVINNECKIRFKYQYINEKWKLKYVAKEMQYIVDP